MYDYKMAGAAPYWDRANNCVRHRDTPRVGQRGQRWEMHKPTTVPVARWECGFGV